MDTTIDKSASHFNIFCTIDLAAIQLSGEQIRLGLSSIVQMNTSQLTHWALTHLGTKPDFHSTDTFILTV